jgi:hypothetical protein
LKRRALLVSTLALAACGAKKPRCQRCGMVLDLGSRWLAELVRGDVVERFDTPKCAFVAWRKRPPGDGTIARFRGYYGQKSHAANEVVFALGSDVLGPMGPDLVPVEPEHATRFARDHAASRMVGEGDVTLDLADGL